MGEGGNHQVGAYRHQGAVHILLAHTLVVVGADREKIVGSCTAAAAVVAVAAYVDFGVVEVARVKKKEQGA